VEGNGSHAFPLPDDLNDKGIVMRRELLGAAFTLVLAIVALTPHLAFFLLFWAYALMAPVRSLVIQAHRRAFAPEHTPRLH